MKTIIVIPARYDSSRFPGKPLANIRGMRLIHRVWNNACNTQGVDKIIIATDSALIKQHAERFGAEVVMTSTACVNGTERLHEALSLLNTTHSDGIGVRDDIIINLQGDAPLLPPYLIQQLIAQCKALPKLHIATLASQLTAVQLEQTLHLLDAGKFGGTHVVFNRLGEALYFSKNMIPRITKKQNNPNPPVYKHIGIYAYSMSALTAFVSLKPTDLELCEGLEQLRALENGIPIQVFIADYQGRTDWSVDYPSDIAIVEVIIEKEGEL